MSGKIKTTTNFTERQRNHSAMTSKRNYTQRHTVEQVGQQRQELLVQHLELASTLCNCVVNVRV